MELKELENYRSAVGGGNSSAELSIAFKGGFFPGLRKFKEICTRQAIMASNEIGLNPDLIPALTLLFTIANPAVAELIAHHGTYAIGAALAKTPVLAAGWAKEDATGKGLAEAMGKKEAKKFRNKWNI